MVKIIKKIPISIWVLLIITIIGTILRVYNFSKWLRFGPDQARDAGIIRSIIENGASLPLLGPQMGNTLFYLGPAYYYFKYLSALIFGLNPAALAYPIIFFSILSIPLFYLFLREFFTVRLALILTSLYSLSYFGIVNSRFASNANLIPFFLILFLFSILKITDKNSSRKIWWYILWGISLGIGIQLHALLFVSLPLISFLTFFYLIKKRSLKVWGIAAAVLFFILVNLGQILFDLKNNGRNISAFLKGTESQSSLGDDLFRNVKLVSACQFQANVQIIFPLEKREECRILDISKNVQGGKGGSPDGLLYLSELALVAGFSLGGYIWLWGYLFKEGTSPEKKRFLGLIAVYNLIVLLIFIPVAGEIGTRYFNVLIFMPFILLGLWTKKISEKDWKISLKNGLMFSLILILFVSNVYLIFSEARKFSEGIASDDRVSVLGEIRPVVDYIVSGVKPSKTAYLDGERTSVRRFANALTYLAAQEEVKIIELRKDSERLENEKPFYFIGMTDKEDEKKLMRKVEDYEVLEYKRFGRIYIFRLKLNNNG